MQKFWKPAASLSSAQVAKWFGVIIFGCYACIILVHNQPPILGDFPDWIYSGVLLARHMHGVPDSHHALKHFPVPNSSLTLLLGLLCAVFKWQTAARIYLVFHLGFCYFGIRYLVQTIKPSGWVWFVAPGAMFLSLGFWYGLLAFQLAVALLFLFTGMLLRRLRSENRTYSWPLGILLIVLFFTHMVPFTFACLLLLMYVFQTGDRRLLQLLILPIILLFAYAVGRFTSGDQDSGVAPTVSAHFLSERTVLFKGDTVGKSFGFVNPVHGDPPYSVALQLLGKPLFLFLFAINAIVCVAVLIAQFYVIPYGLRRAEPTRFFWLAHVISLAAYLLVPESLLGISDPGARILQVAIWTSLFFCVSQSPIYRVAIRLIKYGSVVLAIGGLGLFISLGWTYNPPTARESLPHAMELLARVPYLHEADFDREIDKGNFDQAVFPTGLFLNLP